MSNAVVALRRYPVKAMGGEALDRVPVDVRGLIGDRWYAVEDAEGHFASGKDTRRFRRRDAVFDYVARTTDDGVVVKGPEGQWAVGDPCLDATLTARMGTPVHVLPERQVPHHDLGSVSLVGTASLEWCASRWGLDPDVRRLRVNLVISTSVPFIEETWLGRSIAIGGVQLHVAQQVPRCRMIDIDQDGAVARGRWLKPLAQERAMFLGMYANVKQAGVLTIGDPATW